MLGVKVIWRKSLIIPLTMVVAAGVIAVVVSCWQPQQKITNVDVADNTSRRFGAPQVAVNPTDPNNIVVLASINYGFTNECQAAGDPDCELIPQYVMIGETPLSIAPRGFYKTPGFCDIGVFVSNDHGKTFKQIDVSHLYPAGHPEIFAKGEGPLGVTADGTFYIGFNALNWGDWEADPPIGMPNAGVGVIKSTDKGQTWTGAHLTGTPADWPFGALDQSTGRFYVVSGMPGAPLGPNSTGDPNSPMGTIGDRWISSTVDGVNFTEPQPLGGPSPDGKRHISGSHSAASAANGYVATLFSASTRAACEAFVGEEAMPCIIFQTSDDEGKTWNRHRVPVPDDFKVGGLTGLMPAADPSKKGHFAAVLLNSGTTEFSIYTTEDFGETWNGPNVVTDNPGKGHWGSWAEYSPDGVLGLMWKTNERKPAGSKAVYPPYSVWAAISKDGGKTFSKPLKVSNHNSPSAPAEKWGDIWNGILGDHGPSGMTMEGNTAFIAWGDWTPGDRTIMFAAVDFDLFEF